MRKLQSQGVHHITIVGADRQTSIDFWEGVLGMPFVFEQPNLDNESESHLYFDPGDGRLITVFTNEERTPDPTRTSTDIGAVHHVAFALSQATFRQAVERLDERGIKHSGVKDRGFMDSIYFEDPLGLLIELASYRFEPPHGHTHADVLLAAHELRVERGDYNIDQAHLADAIEALAAQSRVALGRPLAEEPLPLGGSRGHEHAEHPEAERQQPDRADLRPGGRARVRRARRLGQEGHTRVPRQGPGRPDAAARGGGAAAGRALGELRDHAVPLQQARPRPLLPDRSRASGRWSTARCST